jgi:NAD(P)-dependent dehydrogenase (short-subunit alcohol dehydrogenase family)
MVEAPKSIFITGGASGIGEAAAFLFAEKGWFVGVVDVNEQKLSAIQKEIGKDNCFIHMLDVTDRDAYNVVISEFGKSTSGKMDILFNNAGIGAAGFFEDIPYERSMELIHVNLIGVVNGIYEAMPLLIATDNSLCFTTSSSAATYGSPGLAIYAATKHAVKGLTEALSIEFKRHNIRAADILPGLIDTPILNETPIYFQKNEIPREGRVQDTAPTKGVMRLIQPSEVAETVWQAYHSDQLHWYVPAELSEVDRMKGESPEMVRERYESQTLFSSIESVK